MSDPKRILVVDDDPDIQAICSIVLKQAGYQVLYADSGLMCREMVEKSEPDLIILDVMMEQADAGFVTAKWLAEHHSFIPVLLMSSIVAAADELFDTSILKVADLVNKPVPPAELLSRVERLLKRANKG